MYTHSGMVHDLRRNAPYKFNSLVSTCVNSSFSNGHSLQFVKGLLVKLVPNMYGALWLPRP